MAEERKGLNRKQGRMKGGTGLGRGGGGQRRSASTSLGGLIPNPTWEGAEMLGKEKEEARSPEVCEPRVPDVLSPVQ